MKNFEVSLSKEELEEICKYPENKNFKHLDLYSNKEILKKMFFYPFNEFFVSIQHGLWIKKTKGIISEVDYLNPYKYALYDRPLPEQFGIKILSIEHPFLYYKRKNNIKLSNKRKGTIVFPLHTLIGIEFYYPIEEYIEKLKNLPKEFHPLLICLHFDDVIENKHHIWYEHGFEVTSAGNGFRSDFVDRFYKILSSVKYATANESTSALYYAIDLGIPAFLYGNEIADKKKTVFKNKFDKINLDENEHSQNFAKYYNLDKFFPITPVKTINKVTKKHVDDILGKNYPKNNRLFVSLVLYKEWIRFKLKHLYLKLIIKKYKKFLAKKSFSIPNHMSLEEKVLLVKFAKNKVVAEIGSFLGSNTINLSNVAKKVYAVDNWNRHPIKNAFSIFKENIKDKKNIEILNGEFEKILNNLPTIDVAIIDGEHHNYEVICRDIQKTFPKLKKGGIIIIHHLKWSIFVKKCIINFLSNKTKEIFYIDNLWIGKKL